MAAACAFGAAVGFLSNVISGWAWRLGGRNVARAPGSSGWQSPFVLQFLVRIVLSFFALWAAFRVSAGNGGVILATLAGLLLARYFLLFRLSSRKDGAGGGPV
jgi:hypothetical protein